MQEYFRCGISPKYNFSAKSSMCQGCKIRGWVTQKAANHFLFFQSKNAKNVSAVRRLVNLNNFGERDFYYWRFTYLERIIFPILLRSTKLCCAHSFDPRGWAMSYLIALPALVTKWDSRHLLKFVVLFQKGRFHIGTGEFLAPNLYPCLGKIGARMFMMHLSSLSLSLLLAVQRLHLLPSLLFLGFGMSCWSMYHCF